MTTPDPLTPEEARRRTSFSLRAVTPDPAEPHDDHRLFMGHHPACGYTIEGDWSACCCGAAIPDPAEPGLDEALDVGIYPASSPAGPRTPWQEGWNAAVIAICDRVEALARSEEPT